jgi:hypothetical protein
VVVVDVDVDVDVPLETLSAGPPGVTVAADEVAAAAEEEVAVIVVVVKPVDTISVNVVVVVAVGLGHTGRVRTVVRPSDRVIVVDWVLARVRSAATNRVDERGGIVRARVIKIVFLYERCDTYHVSWCFNGIIHEGETAVREV